LRLAPISHRECAMLPQSRPRIAVVTPVFNDWAALNQLIDAIDHLAHNSDLAAFEMEIWVVDDGSSERPDLAAMTRTPDLISGVKLIELGTNLGHQRAIATGLVLASRDLEIDGVLVMDCDGEDRPADIPVLLAAARAHPGAIIVAERTKRSENLEFRLFYRLYQAIFRVLTGHRINFGNFSFLPIHAVRSLVLSAALWNNLAAAVSRARMPRLSVPTIRGRRYAGQSRMSLAGLIIHGLSAISVYLDIALVRIILASVLIAGLVLTTMIGVIGIRILTDLAIPGWATSIIALLAIILTQALLSAGMAVFQLLNQRGQRGIIPSEDADIFVRAIHTLVPRVGGKPSP
jgi:polyisoprenyl-phosphate glycosyltransferase